jgi:hypothetical protein
MDTCDFINTEYLYLQNQEHYIFKNYRNIITRENYIKPEIAECIYLPQGESVCIIKTFWIKIIQKTWKKICKQRKEIIKRRCSLICLKYREINGKWPNCCNYYPSVKGMLSI